jgi:hypothetical protein
MSPMEDRLRDAMRSATETVSPGDVQDLEEEIRQRTRSARPAERRRWRLIAPVAAAASVAAIAVLVAVLAAGAPGQGARHGTGHGLGHASSADPKFMISGGGGVSPLQVRSAATGVVVARIRVPESPKSQVPGTPAGRRTYISSVATADGRNYLIALYRPRPCRSWIYRFTLSSRGQASALTPFAALPTIAGAALYAMDISGNGQQVAFAAASSGAICATGKPGPTHIGVTNIGTGRIRQWSVPRADSVNGVSLNDDGRLLAYSLQLRRSEVRVIPTSAAPGPAAGRGRTVVTAAQFGRSKWISFAALSPDSKALYFSVYPPGGGGPGEIRVTGLAGRRSRIVAANAEYPGLITSDPSVRRLLLYVGRKLVKLDLTTGRLTPLPPAWHHYVGEITW